jgi:hypothetical protein
VRSPSECCGAAGLLAYDDFAPPDRKRSTANRSTPVGRDGEKWQMRGSQGGKRWSGSPSATALLRAITSGEPESVYVCHCKACQRRTGAIIHNGSRWLKSQVRIEGEHKIYGRIADSGFEIRFHFCPNCGTSVFWEGRS